MTPRLRRPATGVNGIEKRSVCIPVGVWPELQAMANAINDKADNKTGKITPSTLINVALREWLRDHGLDGEFYTDQQSA